MQYLSRAMIENDSTVILSGHQPKNLEVLCSFSYKLLEERTTPFSHLRFGIYQGFSYLQLVFCPTVHFVGTVKTLSLRSTFKQVLKGDVELGRKRFQFLALCVCVYMCLCVHKWAGHACKTSKVNLYLSFIILKNTYRSAQVNLESHFEIKNQRKRKLYFKLWLELLMHSLN